MLSDGFCVIAMYWRSKTFRTILVYSTRHRRGIKNVLNHFRLSSVCVPVCLCVTNSSTLISRSIFPFNLRLLINFVTVRSPTNRFKAIDARSMFRQVEHFANYAIPAFSLPFCFGEN